MAMNQGEYDFARETFTQSLLISEQLGSPGDIAAKFSWLARIAWEIKKKPGAISLSYISCYLYQSGKHKEAESEVSWLNNKATELELSKEQFDEITQDAVVKYQANGARALIESIWPNK